MEWHEKYEEPRNDYNIDSTNGNDDNLVEISEHENETFSFSVIRLRSLSLYLFLCVSVCRSADMSAILILNDGRHVVIVKYFGCHKCLCDFTPMTTSNWCRMWNENVVGHDKWHSSQSYLYFDCVVVVVVISIDSNKVAIATHQHVRARILSHDHHHFEQRHSNLNPHMPTGRQFRIQILHTYVSHLTSSEGKLNSGNCQPLPSSLGRNVNKVNLRNEINSFGTFYANHRSLSLLQLQLNVTFWMRGQIDATAKIYSISFSFGFMTSQKF